MTEPSDTGSRRTSKALARAPLASLLRDDLDEGRVKAMWQRIDHAPRRRPAFAVVALVMVGLAALALVASGALRERESERLALVSGAAPAVLIADDQPRAPRFEDGSTVSLSRGSRLEVLRNDGRSFVTALRRGDATFDVKPGGSRHWIIEAGELTVEVVGTHFRVVRQSHGTSVDVQRGVVIVRGERVPDGSLRLTAGQRFQLQAAGQEGSEPTSAPPLAASTPGMEPSAATARGDEPPKAPAGSSSMAAPLPRTPEEADQVAQSLHAADLARARRDPAAAAAQFEAAWRAASPGDPRRGLAALSLARLLMTTNPPQAAQVLRSSLSDMPQALLEDAMARLVEAESRSGNAAAAAHAAQEYQRRFPSGQRAHEVERWSAP